MVINITAATLSISTTNPSNGELIFGIFASLAQFERNLISERTRAGLKAARARGRKGRSRLTAKQIKTAQKMYDANSMNMEEIAETVGTTVPTLYRHIEVQPLEPTHYSSPVSLELRDRVYIGSSIRLVFKSALPPKADILGNAQKSPLCAISGHSLILNITSQFYYAMQVEEPTTASLTDRKVGVLFFPRSHYFI